jgi:hypothetical protein
VESSADWYEVLKRVSFAVLVSLVALSDGLVSKGLVTDWLVTVKSSVDETRWALLSTDWMSVTDESWSALFVGETWSLGFAVSSTVNGFASLEGSFGGRIALLDSSLGLFRESVVTADKVSQGIAFGKSLEKSSLLDSGVGLGGDGNVSLGVFSDVIVIRVDTAEAFSDVLSYLSSSNTDESD